MDDYKKTRCSGRDALLKLNVNIAMENSYKLIIDKLSLDDFNDIKGCYFIHNPYREVQESTLNEMLLFYKEKRKWNKCLKIYTLKSKLKFNHELQRLSKKYYK